MPRRARIDIEGYWYHVISRGQRKNPLFFSDKDKEHYLSILNDLLLKFDTMLGAYCLMKNHVHLLLFRKNDSLYRFMHILNTRYANYFNKKYGTVGYVFQGRFISKIVLDERYLNNGVNYIHNNPERAGIVKPGEIYKYSSELFYLKGISNLPIVKVPTWELNGTKNNQSSEQDQDFEEAIHENYIGTESMYKNIDKRKKGREKEKYIERRDKRDIKNDFLRIAKFSMEDLEEIKSSKRNEILFKMRAELTWILYKKNYTISEIARFINKGRTTVYNYIVKLRNTEKL